MLRKWIPNLVCLVLIATGSAGAGTYYEARSTNDGAQGGNLMVRAWVDGNLARVEFQESDNPLMKQGGYLLTRDGGEVVYFVDPDEGTYMEWNLAGMMSGLGGAMQGLGGMVKMEFADQKIEKLLEEPGGSILGYDTTHYRYRSTYSIEVRVMGMVQKTRNDVTQEVWSTTQLEDAGFGVWLRNAPPETGIEGLDEFIAAEMGKIQGFPLKSESVTVSTDQRGRSTTSRTGTEVTLIREEEIDPGLFELDPRLQRVEMPDLGSMFGQP